MPKKTTDPAYARITMTLAALDYSPSTQIGGILKNDTALATGGNWLVVWGPALLGSNLAYIVKNQKPPAAGKPEYGLAVRGTIMSLESILEDAEIFRQYPLPWLKNQVVMISGGMVTAWNHLSSMTPPAGAPGAGETIEQFLTRIEPAATVYVTGHSQGGAIASVAACWLRDILPGRTIIPYTFAAQTAGNDAFGAHFNLLFLGKPGGRFYHHLDIVPKGFVVADLKTIDTLYDPEPPGVETTYLIEDGITVLIDEMKNYGVRYVQCGNRCLIAGDAIVPCTGVDFLNRQSRLDSEVEVQHSHFTYLHLLKAPLTPGALLPWPPTSIPY